MHHAMWVTFTETRCWTSTRTPLYRRRPPATRLPGGAAGDVQGGEEGGSRSEEERSVILSFALLTVVCAVVVAALFLTMWLEEDTLVTAVLGVVLMPLLVLAILAVRVAL